MENVKRYKIEGPLMVIPRDESVTVRMIAHSYGMDGECVIEMQDGSMPTGYEVSEGFAPVQDLLYYAFETWPGKGWTHRLCCTGKTLEEELGEEPDWATAPRLDFWNDRHKRPKRHGFTSLLRAMHNLRFIFAARVNGRWAIIGDEWFGGQFLSCGYHDEKGEIQRSGCAYSWEFTVEPLPHPICYYNGEIGIRKEDGE